MPSPSNARNTNSPAHWLVRCVWYSHFILGFVIVYAGILKNGGDRKYVPINPHAVGMNSCAKAYVNVHSSSMEEPYAIICCPTATNTSTNTKYWSWIMGSYEVALCAGKPDNLPHGFRLTSIKSAWLLPLVPLILRLLITIYQRTGGVEKIGASSHHTDTNNNHIHHGWKMSLRRFLLYFLIMSFRGWGLYILLNNVQDAVLVLLPSSALKQPSSNDTCWYQEYLLYPKHVSKNCYGQHFDFSDHVVLFFGQILPVTLFEVLFCILVPLWSENKNNNNNESSLFDDSTSNKKYKGNNSSSSAHFLLRHISLLILIGGFLYLNIITFIAVHHTAAYFHTAGEVIVGYIVSLFIQLPLGYILLHRHSPNSNSKNTQRADKHDASVEETATLTSSVVTVHRIRNLIGIPNIHFAS